MTEDVRCAYCGEFLAVKDFSGEALPPLYHRPCHERMEAEDLAALSGDTKEAPDGVMSLEQCVEFLGVSKSTLKRIKSRGEIKFTQLSPRRIGIRRSELTRWLDARNA